MLAPHLAQEQRAGPAELAITTLSSLAASHGSSPVAVDSILQETLVLPASTVQDPALGAGIRTVYPNPQISFSNLPK